MTITDLIKQRFPNPIPCPDLPQDWDAGYTVAGAIVLYAGGYQTFPGIAALAVALRNLNAAISTEDAEVFARLIIATGDRGKIKAAWRALDAALACAKPQQHAWRWLLGKWSGIQ